MIELTRLNGLSFHLNPELVEQIESAPDTVITLTTGNNFVVKESVAIVVERILDYRRQIAEKRIQQQERILCSGKGERQ